ncbi:MAG: hypothetical protein HN348_21440 [Proteobacteria bacterium]|nr:hypothetical protein [Pseudomonadota bacterium]
MAKGNVADSREEMLRGVALVEGALLPVARVEQITVAGCAARLYAPEGSAAKPALV